MDRVDVALATYNGARFLPEFLETVAAQTHRNIRIVASDDNSSDPTFDLLRAFQPLTTLAVRNAGARGFRGNFANAIALTDAPHVALADQDDAWISHKIERMLARMKQVEARHGADTPILVCSDLTVVDGDLQTLRSSFFARWGEPVSSLDFADLTLGNRIPGCAMLLNRALVDRAMPIPETIALHDWWLVLVASAFGRVEVMEESLILYRQHGGNQLGDVHEKVSGWNRIRLKLASPVGHLRKRAALFRHTSIDIKATLRAFEARFGDELSPEKAALLHAGTTAGLVRKFWRFRGARAPFGRVFKYMLLYFLDEAERRAAGTSA